MTNTFLDSQLFQTVKLEGVTRLQLPTHPTPLPLTHPFIRAIQDISVVVKKVTQNPAMLASYYRLS